MLILLSSNDVEEHVRGGRGTFIEGRGGDSGTEGKVPDGGEGEKLNIGDGETTPLKLGDFIICFPATTAGS